MNDRAKAEKIKRFLADEAMAASVREELREAFLKPTKNLSVHELAASRLAIDLLDEGFRHLDGFRSENRAENAGSGNPGV